jgi:GNAT superfamily N-acetyltransferase
MAYDHPSQSLCRLRLEIRDIPWSHPDSEYLRRLQQQEIQTIYGRPDSEPGIPPSSDDITIFLIAYLDSSQTLSTENSFSRNIPIACGGLRALPQETLAPGNVEIKRMFVHQSYRGKPWSAAKAVLTALEERARENGWLKIVLETGSLQTAAVKFYCREGYQEIPKFGAYAESTLSLCFEQNLPAKLECN